MSYVLILKIFIDKLNCESLKHELNEKELFNELKNLTSQINILKNNVNNLISIINTQNEEIKNFTHILNSLDTKLIERTEREINKKIRSYYINGQISNFIPTKCNTYD